MSEIFHRTHPLPRSNRAPRAARAAIDSIGHLLDPRQLTDGRLLASELASNAVRHGAGEITLDIHIERDDLCVALEDKGRHQPRLTPTAGVEGGWGLRLVEAIADDWGSEEGSSHVWFILRRTSSRR